ncbi:hypothetical protein GGR50DRAFT_694048 [Xylaria sp. CBS 124048]|nr:hypothetical protein GGR50DRAFT_694048 [Xylaria sp. CBS 124048]
MAPRPWASVLLGIGSILKDSATASRDYQDGDLHSIIPDTEAFLQMSPSIACQQYWPLRTTSTGKTIGSSESVVFLVVCTGHACYDNRIVTEVGFTIFDTRDRWLGTKPQANNTKGCIALGDRGRNLVRLYDSQHYIVADTADHHSGTCASGRHQEKPYDFCYKKSKSIQRKELAKTLELAYSWAAKKGLSDADVKLGVRRSVVLLSWGGELPDAITGTEWFRNTSFAEHWDLRQHDVLKRVFPPGITFADALRAFGVPHTVCGFDIAQNCGNKSSFVMQLLWAMTLATGKQLDVLRNSEDGRLEPWASPGVQSVLTRDNRPPGSGHPGPERIEYTQPPRPARDSYVRVVVKEDTSPSHAKKTLPDCIYLSAYRRRERQSKHKGRQPPHAQRSLPDRRTLAAKNRRRHQSNYKSRIIRRPLRPSSSSRAKNAVKKDTPFRRDLHRIVFGSRPGAEKSTRRVGDRSELELARKRPR